MADRKNPIATGSRELDEAELKRLRERQEEGLEPEQHPGARPNEGIFSAGRLYTSQEEADRAALGEEDARRDDVDRDAAGVRGEPPEQTGE